jgi:lysophospholipase L1-like esterase
MATRREIIAGLGGAALLRTAALEGAETRPRQSLKLAARSKLVMIGDSITDTDRARPVGEGSAEALGKGYVTMVDALLGATYPDLLIRVMNTGISGNTVRNLKARWQTDVLDLQPDWVSVMIGTNDVWRQFDSPRQPDKAVPIKEYEETLDELVRTTLPTVKGMVLMTPFFLEPVRTDAMRAEMDRYGAVVKKVAAARGTVFVDTQAPFDQVLAVSYSAVLARDRVHPNHVGHMILARAFLTGIGFDWTR